MASSVYIKSRGSTSELKNSTIMSMGPNELGLLKAFVEGCKANPGLLHAPELGFFKDYIEGLGGERQHVDTKIPATQSFQLPLPRRQRSSTHTSTRYILFQLLRQHSEIQAKRSCSLSDIDSFCFLFFFFSRLRAYTFGSPTAGTDRSAPVIACNHTCVQFQQTCSTASSPKITTVSKRP